MHDQRDDESLRDPLETILALVEFRKKLLGTLKQSRVTRLAAERQAARFKIQRKAHAVNGSLHGAFGNVQRDTHGPGRLWRIAAIVDLTRVHNHQLSGRQGFADTRDDVIECATQANDDVVLVMRVWQTLQLPRRVTEVVKADLRFLVKPESRCRRLFRLEYHAHQILLPGRQTRSIQNNGY